MSVRRLHPKQAHSFVFSEENLRWADETIAKYPEGKQASAVIPLLWRAQQQNVGWLPEPAIRYVADQLGMASIRVYEIATFYTMFQLAPVGTTAHVQVCGTTPCMLRGSEPLIEVCKRRIANKPHTTSDDGKYSWEEVECLGSCANAPMVQIGKDTFEDLTPELFEAVLDQIAAGGSPKPGSQIGRQASSPITGPTTLITSRQVTERNPAGAGILQLVKPEGLSRPRGGQPDDLKRIDGIGTKLEILLNGLGIYHFDQIAAWTPAIAGWVDDHLQFKGRIEREGWIDQAKTLVAGQTDNSLPSADKGGA